MQRYWTALVLLCGLLALSAVGASTAHHRQRLARERLAAEESGLQADSQRRQALLSEVARRTADATAVQSYLKAWEPHFGRATAPDPLPRLRELLQAEAVHLPVATTAWTAPAAVELLHAGRLQRAQPFSLRAAGDLGLLLIWLGRVEELLPALRVTHLELSPFGSGVALDVTFQLPLPEPPKARQQVPAVAPPTS